MADEKKLPNFGKPLDSKMLQNFATIDKARDVQSALRWWDKHASEEWVGALASKPIGAKKKKGVK